MDMRTTCINNAENLTRPKHSSMDVFSANPRSFTMDRKSPIASKLKVSVAEKLIEYLGNYTDDVLADFGDLLKLANDKKATMASYCTRSSWKVEYIIVLVCNGKHQNQAKDDLEAFLGERSGEFVSWLWDLLLKYTHQSNTTTGLSDLKDVTVTSIDVDNKEQRISRLRDLQNNATGSDDHPLTKDEKCYQLSTSDDVEVFEGFQCCPGFTDPLKEVNTKEIWAQTSRSEIPKKIGATENNYVEALKYGSFKVRGSSGIPAGGEQSMQCVDQYKKIDNSSCNGLSHQLLNSPKREPVSRHLQSFSTENLHPKPFSVANTAESKLSSRAADVVSHLNGRPRGNVWDRLGKPCEDNTVVRGENIDGHGIGIIRRKIVEHNGDGLDDHRLMPSVSDGRFKRKLMGEVPVPGNEGGIFISNTKPDEYRKLEHDVSTMGTLHDAKNVGQKRRFGEISPGPSSDLPSLVDDRDRRLQDKEFQRLSSVKCSHLQSLNGVVSESRKSDIHDRYHALRSDAAFNPRANKRSQAREANAAQALVSACSPLGAKSESLKNEDVVSANRKPVQAHVLDVKLRLRQIEMEMSKLRSKQADVNTDDNLNLSSNSGALNRPEEDIESRTVYVTNVHFAATKEALSLYFSKCGVVVKVIILTDMVTAQPKGSAYITFASKESVEKAVALSGTSFLSRIVKVVRKGEIPAVMPTARKPSQSWFPHIDRQAILQRPYSSSHLQWRRDSPKKVERSLSAAGDKLEASRNTQVQGVVDSGP
ncbi:hypothetical protein HHK36_013423 [Tetracentron sinense]|uniref:RRM domain-containing protein n=1 Tax=Tetracentron sinense TaxID=13715 RepID=A0A835DGQ1_TETSI|nr:hypothetical protein HHK36_013423 [Tetracentron sinense]